MKKIPDFDTELAQAIDFVINSDLARKAMINPPFGDFTNILISIIQHIDRLADNCHMPEFTNHALPHICSIVKRASEWAVSDGWIETITEQEAGYLLMALLIHDIGMLSQDVEEIPDDKKETYLKGLSDISNWVRRTHVIRIDKLVKQLLQEPFIARQGSEKLMPHLNVIIGMAASHSKWPWERNFVSNVTDIDALGFNAERIAALNAVIAVCDLLDEDSNRCDTVTLIKHRQGTIENMAHWIRHSLTKEVIGVHNHSVSVYFRMLKPGCENLEMVYRTLRNHYKLVKLYNNKLMTIHADIRDISFYPADGCPDYEDDISNDIQIYKNIKEFEFELAPYLMKTFMQEALNLDGGDCQVRNQLNAIGLENIDLTSMEAFMKPNTLLYPEERVIYGEASIEQRLVYMKKKADAAYLDGKIGELRHLCMEVFDVIENREISLNKVYWAITYLTVYELFHSDYFMVAHKYKNQLKPFQEEHTILADGCYHGLIDVLFMFMELSLSQDRLISYKEHILSVDYTHIVEDEATALLLQSVIGLFWFWRYYGAELWLDLSQKLEECIPSEHLKALLMRQRERLIVQERILDHTDLVEQADIDECELPVFARAWTHFYLNNLTRMQDDIPRLVSYAEYHTDYYPAVQGYQNITRGILYWNKMELDGKIVNSEYAGIYRYQRMTSEQPLALYWRLRESKIEELLAQSSLSPAENANERAHVIRLIAFRNIESLANWNLGEYIESIRNYAQWLYSMSTYMDKYDDYCGDAAFLPETVIYGMQGLHSKIFSEDEIKRLFICMGRYYPDGYHQIFRYCMGNPCKIQWEHMVEWLRYIVCELSQDEISELLGWLLKYQEYVTFIMHLNLDEYAFLEAVVDKFREDDWPKVMRLVEHLFSDVHIYASNKKFGRKLLLYMPEELCKDMVARMAAWPLVDVGKMKTDILYGTVLTLAEKRPELKAYLTQMVKELDKRESNWLYRELLSLIPADSLSDRDTIDWEHITEVVDSTLDGFVKEGVISTGLYSSDTMLDVKNAFLNQNWNLLSEEQLSSLTHKLGDFLIKYYEKLSPHYFNDFSYLFSSLARMSNDQERAEIGRIYVQNFMHTASENGREQNYYADGPLQTVHLDFGESGLVERSILQVLLNCITDLSEEDAEEFRQWVESIFPDYKKVDLFYYGTMVFAYYFFHGNEKVSADSYAWLMYIRGALEISKDESCLKRTIFALQIMDGLPDWTNPTGTEGVEGRKLAFEKQFVERVLIAAKHSNVRIEV